MSIETTVVQRLSETLDVPVSLSVPPTRAPRFVTVERTGGDTEAHRARPILAIQAWDETPAKAADLMENHVIPQLERLVELDPIALVEIESTVHLPDPGPPWRERYQTTIQITAAR